MEFQLKAWTSRAILTPKTFLPNMYNEVEEEKFCLPFRILTQGVEGLRGILLAAIQGEASNSMEDPCVMPTQIRACDWKAWVHYRGTFGAVVEDPYVPLSRFNLILNLLLILLTYLIYQTPRHTLLGRCPGHCLPFHR